MLHSGSVKFVVQYLGEVQQKKKVPTPEEKALIDKKNSSFLPEVLLSGIAYSLPNYLAFKYILKDYPVYRFRMGATAGMFIYGAFDGVRRSGTRFLIEFMSLENSPTAHEAREIIKRDNPAHPFLLKLEEKKRVLGTVSSSSSSTVPVVFEDVTFQLPPPVDKEVTLPMRSSSNSITNSVHAMATNAREFVGEDVFASDTWNQEDVSVQKSSVRQGSAKPAVSGHKKSWEDIQREFESKTEK